MTGPAADLLHKELAAAGFFVLGRFAAKPADKLPRLPDRRPVRSVCMIANAGADLWEPFCRTPEYADGLPDPLDRYTSRCLSQLAERFGFSPLFPFDGPPYHPFQRWAQRAAELSQSPLGLLVSPVYGPWLGLRAAFLSAEETEDETGTARGEGPCPGCDNKPCITACPAGAINLQQGYDAKRCASHLALTEHSRCWSGCLSRARCPFGQRFAPPPKQARLHMEAFLSLLAPTAKKT